MEEETFEAIPPLSYALASRWRRLFGVIIDNLISTVISLAILWYAGIFQQLTELLQEQQTVPMNYNLTFFFVGLIVFLILHGYLLFTRGQTIGKFLLKTKIVDLEGNLPFFPKLIILRYAVIWLLTMIPYIGWLIGFGGVLLIFGKERRCLHDYIAGTRVVNA